MTLGPSGVRLGPSNGLIVAYLMDPLRCTYPGGCNLVSVRDVASGHVLIAERGVAGGSYLLGSANMTWREVHTAIAELAGVAAPRLELTHLLAYLAATVDEVRAALAHRVALSTREQAEMVGRCYWYSHAKAAGIGYSPMPARDALSRRSPGWLLRHMSLGRLGSTCGLRMRSTGFVREELAVENVPQSGRVEATSA